MKRLAITLDLRANLYFWIAAGSAFLVQTEALERWSAAAGSASVCEAAETGVVALTA